VSDAVLALGLLFVARLLAVRAALLLVLAKASSALLPDQLGCLVEKLTTKP